MEANTYPVTRTDAEWRARLTPEQREMFDPLARVWMRGQGRKGYPMVVPGVAPVP